MDKVYVVFGTCGEYSDRMIWTVVAYADEDTAKRHVEEASSYMRRIRAMYNDHIRELPYNEEVAFRDALKRQNKLDPFGDYSVGGLDDVSYWIDCVSIGRDVPKIDEGDLIPI
ncbi:MAG: hypothetical protein E6R03_04295 [Hyphomicrobiaceae bacterium]|nr:MAG: hypothetical protein E6R03_04295 [Hyphomicrobiaceae bacterium]